MHEDLSAFHQAISQDLNEPLTSAQMFDKVFGERETMRKLGIYYADAVCNKPGAAGTYLYIVFTQFKMDFLEVAQTCVVQKITFSNSIFINVKILTFFNHSEFRYRLSKFLWIKQRKRFNKCHQKNEPKTITSFRRDWIRDILLELCQF